MRTFFTSESVSEGHPDKMADQISDAVLDAALVKDPNARVACETYLCKQFALIGGEVRFKGELDYEGIARRVIQEIGYRSVEDGFDPNIAEFQVRMNSQSEDIAQGVDERPGKELGAGDQGIMFGYATDETPENMPLTISLAHNLVRRLSDLRKSGVVDFLRPDSKSQVTVESENGRPKRVSAVVLSTQHSPKIDQGELREYLIQEVVKPVIGEEWLDEKTQYFLNPTGQFLVGGPAGDCGLTGRKIIVDTYGGHGAHGGGAFSGKDATKVDRSAAYGARHIAKNIVAAGLSDRCLVQLSYAIGVSEPVSILIEDFGTGRVSLEKLGKFVRELWSLKPSSLISDFRLNEPRFFKTAAYGHFGRSDPDFTWENTNKVDELRKLF